MAQFSVGANNGGLTLSTSTLSNIYLRKKRIDDSLARKIQAALKVAPGFLSSDHSRWLAASTEERELISRVLSLPPKAKDHLSEFLRCLSQTA